MGESGKARFVQPSQQATGVAVTQIELAPGNLRQLRDRCLGDPARAIAAPGEPQGIKAGIVCDVDEGLRAGSVAASEMPTGE